MTPVTVEVPPPEVFTPAPPPAPTPPPPQPEPPKVVTPVPTNRFVGDWIALEDWTAVNNLGRPRRLTTATNLTYEVRAAEGVLALTVGSHLVHWNRLDCWLGYAPRFTNGQAQIHILDAEKTLRPLAAPPAVSARTNRVILIDPGHGGDNTGTGSAAGNRFEKTYTLDWALRLQPLLAARGWKVHLTRSNDVNIPLPARVALADQVQADLVVSLHFNSAPAHPQQAGVETYIVTPTGLPSSLTRNFEDDVRAVFPNNAYDADNLRYAICLHRALLQKTGSLDRGVRRARFMGVLRSQNRPAVLLEGGYLSNPREAGMIARADYRQRLAEAVAHALGEELVVAGPMRGESTGGR